MTPPSGPTCSVCQRPMKFAGGGAVSALYKCEHCKLQVMVPGEGHDGRAASPGMAAPPDPVAPAVQGTGPAGQHPHLQLAPIQQGVPVERERPKYGWMIVVAVLLAIAVWLVLK